MEKIVLASSSPRRRELLESIQIPFETAIPGISEEIEEQNPEKLVSTLARQKVEAVLSRKPELKMRWIIGADTIVLFRGTIIGKPDSEGQARDYLNRLAGNTHRVITGLALHPPGMPEKNGPIGTKVSSTEVTLSTMKPEEIEWYLSTGEWEGAAGGYRIQERGGLFVTHLIGSPSNVVGLPIHTFYGMLRAAKYQFNAT